MKTTKDLRRGEWFVATCYWATWHSATRVRVKHLDPIRCFSPIADSDPLNLVCSCEYESAAQIIAKMHACLPHTSSHQLRNGDSVWVYGVRGSGRVYIRDYYWRCVAEGGEVADKQVLAQG